MLTTGSRAACLVGRLWSQAASQAIPQNFALFVAWGGSFSLLVIPEMNCKRKYYMS
jgi:hypothetical protein